ASSTVRDIAILKIAGVGLPTVELGDSSSISNGDTILTIGNPLGLQNTISQGLISSTNRVINGLNFIQISAPISPGSSGGVMVDYFGRVLGVTSASFVSGQNLNLAIPINEVKPIIGQIDLIGVPFGQHAVIKVTSIAVTSLGNVSTLALSQQLQMVASVLPTNATNTQVTWSVRSGTGSATISSTGLVSPIQLGTVTVRATAQDGSQVFGERTITITQTQSSSSSTVYEKEPNNTLGTANRLQSGVGELVVFGSITGTSSDVDYYRLDVTSSINIRVLGVWVGSNIAGLGFENDLGIGLLDSSGKLLDVATFYSSGGTTFLMLETSLVPGVYYLVVLVLGRYPSLYLNEAYGLTITITGR
ncbi:MAG: trypsin-like peptidase domain-containing protein, partial [bacterium]|nr:trypsin-like peptidase domain-containing protein [bacterium]